MSGRAKTYRFATPDQWSSCLTYALHGRRERVLELAAPLGPIPAESIPEPQGACTVAASPHGVVIWTTCDGALHWREPCANEDCSLRPAGDIARSPRLVVDRESLWAFDPAGTTLYRHRRETFDLQRSINLPFDGGRIRDVASDFRQGLWVLVSIGVEKAVHIDCQGEIVAEIPLDKCRARFRALLYLKRSERLLLLAEDGRSLHWLRADGAGDCVGARSDTIEPCLVIESIASNFWDDVAIFGKLDDALDGKSRLYIVDDNGSPTSGPAFIPLQSDCCAQRVAMDRRNVWVATETALLRFERGGSIGGHAEGLILTPALLSPEGDVARGWLRAEIDAEVPKGTSVVVEFASTDDDRVQGALTVLAADAMRAPRDRIELVWNNLDADAARLVFSGSNENPSALLAIPLVNAKGRWLWLRVRLIAAPGSESPRVCELRVLYPDVSLMEQLPAMFQGDNDPGAGLRRLVGVMETTFHSLDERIRSVARMLDPRSAPVKWLDYVASWLDLPWDDSLPELTKRRLLSGAALLLARRGTRAGLELLLTCLFGDAQARIVDTNADFEPARLSSGACRGTRLPALLAGKQRGLATLGGKAVLGRTHLLCKPTDRDPLQVLTPTLRLEIVATPAQRAMRDVLEALLEQYVPAGLRVVIRWRGTSTIGTSVRVDDFVLDGFGTGRLGDDARLGRTTLGGTTGRIGFELR